MRRHIAVAWPLLSLTLLTGCFGDRELNDIREQLSTVDIQIDREGEKPSVLYTANIRSETLYCGGYINGMNQLDNLGGSGTFSSGFNATAFLQPGSNKMSLKIVPSGAYEGDFTYKPEDNCQVTLYGAFEDGAKKELSSLTVTIEDEKPTIKTSKTYPDNYQTPLDNVDGILKHRLTDFTRPIYIKTIPRWRWVDATPFDENNPAHMKKLYRAYTNLLRLMELRDFEGLEMAWSLSNREKAKAEAYYSTEDDFFATLGFESEFKRYEDAQVAPRREWHEYTLESFMGGRLVRLKDKRSSSPLRIWSMEEDVEVSTTPYFSIIDGRVVVSR